MATPLETPGIPPSSSQATPQQLVLFKKKKFTSLGVDIKSINEQGRLAKTDASQVSMFKGMFRSLDSLHDKFCMVWDDLIYLHLLHPQLGVFPSENEQEKFNAIKRYYFEACSTLEALTPPPIRMEETHSATHNVTVNSSRARLPKINLPIFSGKINSWPFFRDTYTSLIHDDESLSSIEKYHFLIGSLQGSALDVIKPIAIVAENYDQAWEALMKCYDNKRKLATNYLHELINFKPIQGKASTSALKHFLSVVSENITAFKNLKIPDPAEFILFDLAIRCLDNSTRKAFELCHTDITFPTFDHLVKFVNKRCQGMSMLYEEPKSSPKVTLPLSSPNRYQNKRTTSKPSFKTSATLLAQSSHRSRSSNNSDTFKTDSKTSWPICFLCSKKHRLLDCSTFKDASPSGRLELLKNWNGCRNCLHPYHRTKECNSKWTCRKCHKSHHTMLHLSAEANTGTSPTVVLPNLSNRDQIENNKELSSSATALTSSPAHPTRVLLGTALAQFRDWKGEFHTLRIVLDSGSQHSFITQQCADLLGNQKSSIHKVITGIGQSTLLNPQESIPCIIKPHRSERPLLETNAIILTSISQHLPQTYLPSVIWRKHLQLDLADPQFWIPGPIDFLLGADLFGKVITGTPRSVHPNEPYLIKTVFGDVLMGPYQPPPSSSSVSSNSYTGLCCQEPELDVTLQKFWEIEEVQTVAKASMEDSKCEQHFEETHYRLPSGRYVVALPFKTTSVLLDSSRDRALQRLHNLESRFFKQPNLLIPYDKFMQEYLDLEHMSKTTAQARYVIPHHPVIKTNDKGDITKIRVVFDASAKSRLGSLNDKLATGPKLQLDIQNILLNFRRYRVAITTDIVKMYRQIEIRPEDRVYQHILWRRHPSCPVEEFQLNTVTYGLACSPYLALRVIKQLVIDEGAAYTTAAQVLGRDIYVDDIVTGADSCQEARILMAEIIELLGRGGFQLSKWTSNHPELLAELSKGVQPQPVSLVPEDVNQVKILGLQWDPSADCFSYQVKALHEGTYTKRLILSLIARIYDPLGYITPVVFRAKCFLQEIWKTKSGWDDPVSPTIAEDWIAFVDQLHHLEKLQIPRFLLGAIDHSYNLLGFCDASQKGYCGALYLQHGSSLSTIYLIKAKSKVAPLKSMTIPRLELCAALLLTKLYISVQQFLSSIHISDVVFFTDSSIVLGWLHSPPHLLKTFVANRVSEILETTSTSCWRHIQTKDNPADCGSRGQLPLQILQNPLWWKGPPWVSGPRNEWPESNINQRYGDLPELKSGEVVLNSTEIPFINNWMERFSSYLRMVRVVAWMRRFFNNSRLSPEVRTSGPINAEEFRKAEACIIRLLQRQYYPEAYDDNGSLTPYLRSLNVFVDPDGLLRVGGRIRQATIDSSHKHPLLLPKRCHFSSILVDHMHRRHLHIGPGALQAIIQLQYWVPALKSLVKQRLRRCLICFKSSRVSTITPYMADLPKSRFSEVRPFYHTGVDLAGPFICRDSARRKSGTHKAYLAVFVCLSVKALHLEVVSSLSTEAFLDAFERFIARRGIPARVFSDCGTNFVGAHNYLCDMYSWLQSQDTQRHIIHSSSSRGIQWSFNPPKAPHFGGLWEAGVKSVKNLLYKITNNQSYTEGELVTMFTKIEGILNSRPITPLSNDPNDLEPLTPGHFLVGHPLSSLPEPDWSDVEENRLSRWQILRQRVQTFWDRWRKEYLRTLQQRTKWTSRCGDVQIGDMVLIHEPNLPVLRWQLGRITATHPGEDGITRVVTLKTSKGTYKRPVTQLVSLQPLVHTT